MRALLAVLVLGLAACDGATTADLEGGPAADGYTMEIRASEAEQTYVITAPDGRLVAARAADGASALMDAAGVQALAAMAAPEEPAVEVMSLRVPGFSMSVGGEKEDANGEGGHVAMNIGGGGQNIVVNADEGGPGEGDDRAYVRITGADEAAVRNFIVEADELSPSVQAEMLAALGIE